MCRCRYAASHSPAPFHNYVITTAAATAHECTAPVCSPWATQAKATHTPPSAVSSLCCWLVVAVLFRRLNRLCLPLPPEPKRPRQKKPDWKPYACAVDFAHGQWFQRLKSIVWVILQVKVGAETCHAGNAERTIHADLVDNLAATPC